MRWPEVVRDRIRKLESAGAAEPAPPAPEEIAPVPAVIPTDEAGISAPAVMVTAGTPVPGPENAAPPVDQVTAVKEELDGFIHKLADLLGRF